MATLERIIEELSVGKTNAMKVPDFEKAIGNKPKGTNNDETRREVKEILLHLSDMGTIK